MEVVYTSATSGNRSNFKNQIKLVYFYIKLCITLLDSG